MPELFPFSGSITPPVYARVCERERERACAFKEMFSGFILLNLLYRNSFCFQQSRSPAKLLPSQYMEAHFPTSNPPIKVVKFRD